MMQTKAWYVTPPRKDGTRLWQYEGEFMAIEIAAQQSMIPTSALPREHGESIRYIKMTVGYMGTSGVQVTPILMHANQASAIYLPTKVTQLFEVGSTPSYESTLEWNDINFVTPLRKMQENTTYGMATIYLHGATAGTDECFVHILAELF